MAKLTLTDAQRTLLGIITSVESGVTSPEDAVKEQETLKAEAQAAGLNLNANYTLADFQQVRAAYAAQYESSETYVEPSYEASESY